MVKNNYYKSYIPVYIIIWLCLTVAMFSTKFYFRDQVSLQLLDILKIIYSIGILVYIQLIFLHCSLKANNYIKTNHRDLYERYKIKNQKRYGLRNDFAAISFLFSNDNFEDAMIDKIKADGKALYLLSVIFFISIVIVNVTI